MRAMLWEVDPHDDDGLQHGEECWRLAKIQAAWLASADVALIELPPWPVKPTPVEDLLAARALSDDADRRP